jgi:uncharacterized membrane protein YheB (UPF0754 family)
MYISIYQHTSGVKLSPPKHSFEIHCFNEKTRDEVKKEIKNNILLCIKKEKEGTTESNDKRIEEKVDEKVEEKVEENTKEQVEEEVKVSTNDEIPDSGSATAKSSTAYFFANADINTRSSKYIVKGQDVKFLRKNGDFIYVNFTYQNYFTEGWMLISDFENFRNDQLN